MSVFGQHMRSPIDELLDGLIGRMHAGSFWTRCEYSASERYDLHVTVLNEGNEADEIKLLVHDGCDSGQIMTLFDFESRQWVRRFEMVSYWPVMDDEIDRVRFSRPK